MKHLAEGSPRLRTILQRAMADFFFRFKPSKRNLYRHLARRIKNNGWSGSIATLNYDRLLQLSLLQAGLPVFVSSTPSSKDSIEICFPHGCCHIFCDSVRARADSVSFGGSAIKTMGNIRVISDPAEFHSRIENDAFPPVMSYIDPEKETTSGVNFINSQRERWRVLVQNATSIIIVGVRVNTNDIHIWEPLANAPGRIVYCSGPTSAEEYIEWQAGFRPSSQGFVNPEYFKDGLQMIYTELGL